MSTRLWRHPAVCASQGLGPVGNANMHVTTTWYLICGATGAPAARARPPDLQRLQRELCLEDAQEAADICRSAGLPVGLAPDKRQLQTSLPHQVRLAWWQHFLAWRHLITIIIILSSSGAIISALKPFNVARIMLDMITCCSHCSLLSCMWSCTISAVYWLMLQSWLSWGVLYSSVRLVHVGSGSPRAK